MSFEPSPLAPRPSPDDQARDRDLGFGSVVNRESRQRLLNHDGSFNVARYGLGFLESFAPYHLMLTISWTGFLGIVSASYLALNLLFAVAYLACGHDALIGTLEAMPGGGFSRAFFFSIQTFATIGYGQLAPNGMRREPRRDGRSAGGPDVSGAGHRPAIRPVHQAERRTPLQPQRRGRTVRRRRGPHVPDREPAPERDHRARRTGPVQRHGGRRARRHGAALPSARARAQQGHVLSAVVDHRASDRRQQPAGGTNTRKTSNARRPKSSSCCRAWTRRWSRPCTSGRPTGPTKSSGTRDSSRCTCRPMHGRALRWTSAGSTKSSASGRTRTQTQATPAFCVAVLRSGEIG